MSLNSTVIHAQSSNPSYLVQTILAGLLLLSPAFAISDKSDSISFNFKSGTVYQALHTLIHEHGLTIIFPDDLPDQSLDASCENCSHEEAIQSVLANSNLLWQRSKNQFIIYQPINSFRFGISGQAVDAKTGEPIPFANVFIKQLNIGDISKSNGFFSISNISTKTCSLSISYIGYETQNIGLVFPKDESQFLSIPLAKNIILSKGVVITGETREFMEQSNSPGTITFSPRHISTLPNLGEVDIFRSLHLLPGIQFGSGGTSELFIRGGTPDQNLILLDGIPLYSTGHMFGFVSGINANAIKDIQVYKGGAPANFGGRVSSFIKLTSRNGNSLSPSGSVYGNLMSQGISGECPLFSRGSWIFNLRTSTNTDFQTSLYKSIQDFVTGDDNFNLLGESAQEGQKSVYSPQFSYFDFVQRMSIIISPKHRLTLTQSVAMDSIKENRNFYGFSNLLFYDTTYTHSITEWRNDGISSTISSQWNPESNTELTLSHLKHASRYESAHSAETQSGLVSLSSTMEDNTLQDQSIKFNHEYKGIPDHKINSGIEETFYEIKFEDQKEDGSTPFKSLLNQRGFLHAFYLQDHWSFNEKININSGVRMNVYNETSSFKISPRFSIRYQPTSKFFVETSLGKYHQFIHQITGRETTRGTQGMWLLSSESIPVLSATNFHLGVNVNESNLSASAEVYFKTLDNLVHFSGTIMPANYSLNRDTHDSKFMYIGEGTTKGLELLLRKKTGSFTGWISYQFNRSEQTFSGLNQGNSFLSDHDKTHELKAVFITTIGTWDFTASGLYSSGNVYTHQDEISVNDSYQISYHSKINEERLPSIHHLDISISKKVTLQSIHLHSGFSIYNVYNKNNFSHRRYNPYTPAISMTDVTLFGVTPTFFLKVNF